jgi:DNA-binding transcriptional LysR family regulator
MVDMRLIAPVLAELQRALMGLQLRVLRGNAGEIGEALQKGRVELAVAGPLGHAWDRLDANPLFEESFELVMHREHPLANVEVVEVRELAGHRLLMSEQCEQVEGLTQVLDERNISAGGRHRIDSLDDILAMITAKLGIALLPQSAGRHAELRRVAVSDLELGRMVSLYGVAGRQRSAAGDAFMKLLRARDWSGSLT